MKKIFLCLLWVFFYLTSYAFEYKNGDFKAKVFGELYVDLFYTYMYDSDKISYSFDEYAFTGSSALGIELSYKNISATFEAGMKDPVRKYFLTYNFNKSDNHFISIGKNENIAYYTFGEVSHNLGGLCDFGTLNDATKRLQLRYGIKGFELALIIPSLAGSWNELYNDDIGYKLGDENYTPFYVIPRIETTYTYTLEDFRLKLYGAYGAYLYEDTTKIAKDKVFHSYLFGVGGQADFGTSFFQFTVWYGANLDLMEALTNYENRSVKVVNGKMSMFLDNGNMAENIGSFGAAIGMGHTFYDKYTPQFGLGYTFNFGDGYNTIDDALGFYVNFVFQINEWLSITPELSYMDYMQTSNGNDDGYDIIAGAMVLLIF